MSDDVFVVCVYIGLFTAVLSLGYGLAAVMFDREGYFRYRRASRDDRRPGNGVQGKGSPHDPTPARPTRSRP